MQAMVKALRPVQWVKNALLFTPLFLAHEFRDLGALITVVWAFIAFSLCASALYVINDLLDIESDRQHPMKRLRPFASGELTVSAGLVMAPVLLLTGFSIALLALPPLFVAVLAVYAGLAAAYSVRLKRIVVVDVLVLASLYAWRVIAGGVAGGVPVSPWLLAFSLFFFLSLAFAKRYAELHLVAGQGKEEAAGRGYHLDDLSIVQSVGIASAYVAVLVLALYINSDQVTTLYTKPGLLWMVTPLLLYWVTRLWFLAHRGEVTDDPIVSTVRDPVSWGVAVGITGVLLLAI